MNFYLFVYLHSIDPYMAGAQVGIEAVGDKRVNHHLDGINLIPSIQ
jgi:hypothetical protein